jgi:hypothetical protein
MKVIIVKLTHGEDVAFGEREQGSVSYLRVRDSGVSLTSSAGTPLHVSTLFGASDSEAFVLALEACRNEREVLKVCENMLPRYLGGPNKGQTLHKPELFDPRINAGLGAARG